MIRNEFDILAKAGRPRIEFNPAISYEHPYLNRRLYGIELMHIYYDINDIFRDVSMRTSYIAKNIINEKTGETAIDSVAITDDEKNTIFRSLMIDAFNVVFESLKPFTKGLRGNIVRYRDEATGEEFKGEYNEHEDYKTGDVVSYKGRLYECVTANIGRIGDVDYFVDTPCFHIAEYWLKKPYWFNINAKSKLDNSIREAIISYIIYRWFLTCNPQQAEMYLQEHNKRMDDVLFDANSQDKPVRRKYRLF